MCKIKPETIISERMSERCVKMRVGAMYAILFSLVIGSAFKIFI